MNYKGVLSGLFTLISHHKSILIRGEITDSAERTSALLHEHLSVQIKTRLECHLLFNSRHRIDSRGKECGKEDGKPDMLLLFMSIITSQKMHERMHASQ